LQRKEGQKLASTFCKRSSFRVVLGPRGVCAGYGGGGQLEKVEFSFSLCTLGLKGIPLSKVPRIRRSTSRTTKKELEISPDLQEVLSLHKKGSGKREIERDPYASSKVITCLAERGCLSSCGGKGEDGFGDGITGCRSFTEYKERKNERLGLGKPSHCQAHDSREKWGGTMLKKN